MFRKELITTYIEKEVFRKELITIYIVKEVLIWDLITTYIEKEVFRKDLITILKKDMKLNPVVGAAVVGATVGLVPEHHPS